MDEKAENKLVSAGFLSAVAASLCCIGPVLALLSGASGLATAFSWVAPARPFLIASTVALLGFAWFQKLEPVRLEGMQCSCDASGKLPFLQTPFFLAVVTGFAALAIFFPQFSGMLLTQKPKTVGVVPLERGKSAMFQISGMTCQSCEEHVRQGVNKLDGVIEVTADHQGGRAEVRFDGARTTIDEIGTAIEKAGYKVEGRE